MIWITGGADVDAAVFLETIGVGDIGIREEMVRLGEGSRLAGVENIDVVCKGPGSDDLAGDLLNNVVGVEVLDADICIEDFGVGDAPGCGEPLVEEPFFDGLGPIEDGIDEGVEFGMLTEEGRGEAEVAEMLDGSSDPSVTSVSEDGKISSGEYSGSGKSDLCICEEEMNVPLLPFVKPSGIITEPLSTSPFLQGSTEQIPGLLTEEKHPSLLSSGINFGA